MSETKEPIFRYGKTEIEYLKQRDPKLGALIDQIGPIERAVDTDLFSAIVHHIVGQQISTKAQQTICLLYPSRELCWSVWKSKCRYK